MTGKKKTSLKRPKHAMPSDIEKALMDNGLWEDYNSRPAYQQNDYIGWIIRAKLPETRSKRLLQMLEELKKGGVYMKMKHGASSK